VTNERLAVSAAELDDLDLEAVRRFVDDRAPQLARALSFEDAATRLGILSKVAARCCPTLVGLYTFGRAPQIYFPEWGVSCVAIEGAQLTDPVSTRRDVEGGLVALVRESTDFVRRQSGGSLSPEGEYAEVSIREAIVNALVHRDLRKPSRVAVRAFSDRLEVWSPGGPGEGLPDLEELAREGGISHARNPLLAAMARHLGLSEQIGRGLVLLAHAAPPAGERKLEIRASPREVLVVIPSRWNRPRAELS
jgi:ATP-dependent DNA helicase RecG